MDRMILNGILSLSVVFTIVSAVKIPPTMTFKPKDVVYFMDRQEFQCTAEGSTPITYIWKKKSPTASDFETIPGTKNGKLTIPDPTRLDQGIYRCYAKNSAGMAMSSSFELIHARLGTFPAEGTVPTNEMSVNIGEHVVLPCRGIPTCQPPPIFQWAIDKSTLDETPNVVADQNGNLHIIVSSLDDQIPKDNQASKNKVYRCSVYNSIRRASSYGSDTTLKVLGTQGKPRDPSISFHTTSNTKDGSKRIEAIMGNNTLELQCIPDGNPLPTILWTRGGKDIWTLPEYKGRLSWKGSPTQTTYTLRIHDIQEEDQGEYRCHISDRRDIYEKMDVLVFSKPMKLDNQPDTIPVDTVLLSGTSREFKCDGRSANNHGSVEVTWYKDGKKLYPGQNANLRVQNTRLKLNGASKAHDIMSMACMLKNKYGEKLIGFSVNVIDATKITEKRVIEEYGDEKNSWEMVEELKFENVIRSEKPLKITMKVRAEADELLRDELKRTWKHDGVEITTKDSSRQIYIDSQTGDLILQNNATKKELIENLYGKYACHVTVPGVPDADMVLFTKLKAPGGLVKPVAAKTPFPIWIIGLILGVILLILVIILIIFFMYRNRGAIWKVDEKERAAGNNIEKELADSGFHDLGRADGPDDEKKPIDQRSLSDDEPPPGEDTASLDEYGEPDMSKFNEEGSFIDMYGKPVRKSQARPDSLGYQQEPEDQQQLYNNVTPPPVYSQYPVPERRHSHDTMV